MFNIRGTGIPNAKSRLKKSIFNESGVKLSTIIEHDIINCGDFEDFDITVTNCPEGKLGELYFDAIHQAYSSMRWDRCFDICDMMNCNGNYSRYGLTLEPYTGNFEDIAKNLICYHSAYTSDDTIYFACFSNKPKTVYIVVIEDIDDNDIPYDCYENTEEDIDSDDIDFDNLGIDNYMEDV